MNEKIGSITYQFKIIATILKNKEFLEQVYDIINVKYFEESHEWIISKILWYYQQYKETPTREVFKKEVDALNDNTKKIAIVESLKNIYSAHESTDLKYVEDKFLEFCRQQEMKNAILESVDFLKNNDYDKIKNRVDKALKAGESKNIGHRWNDELKDRITNIARDTIPTPWASLNSIIDGGSGKGELYCIIGQAGGGKSWMLSAIGSAAALGGFTIVHYTMELSEKYVGLRYDSILSGIEPIKIKNNYNLVKEKLDEVAGKIIIKEFPTKSITTHAINAHLDQLQRLGITADLVIIDYADLLRGTEKSEARYQELGIIYEDLRRLAMERKLPVWTVSQAQRAAANDNIIEGDRIAESYTKMFIADFIMSIQRRKEDKIANTAKLHIIKNRVGKDGITLPMEFDTSRGLMEIYEPNSPQGIALMERSAPIDVKEVMRKKLEQYKDIDLG